MGILDLIFGSKKAKTAPAPRVPTVRPNRPRAPHQQVLDQHFAFIEEIKVHYKQREQGPKFLDRAITACEKQIAMSADDSAAFKADGFSPLPSHTGFKQLAIIYEKQGNLTGAIDLAKRAKREGWAGDWDKRIARCQKRLKGSK